MGQVMAEQAQAQTQPDAEKQAEEEVIRGPGVGDGAFSIPGERVWELALALLSGGQARNLSAALELSAQQLAFLIHDPAAETKIRRDVITRTRKGGKVLNKQSVKINLCPTADVEENPEALWNECWELEVQLEPHKLIRSLN